MDKGKRFFQPKQYVSLKGRERWVTYFHNHKFCTYGKLWNFYPIRELHFIYAYGDWGLARQADIFFFLLKSKWRKNKISLILMEVGSKWPLRSADFKSAKKVAKSCLELVENRWFLSLNSMLWFFTLDLLRSFENGRQIALRRIDLSLHSDYRLRETAIW